MNKAGVAPHDKGDTWQFFTAPLTARRYIMLQTPGVRLSLVLG